MTKSKSVNLISVLSVLILAVSLLLSIVNITGAWFTDGSADGGSKTINAIIKTGEVNLNVYQEDSTGTQTLLSKSLPTGYTQLEYIESTGTQYIDTGYIPNENSKFNITFLVNEANIKVDTPLFGARTSSHTNSYTFWCHGEGYTDSSVSPFIFNSKEIDLGHYTINKIHNIEYENGSYTRDGVTTSFTKTDAGSPNANLVLFGLNNGGSIDSRKFIGYVYNFKIYESGILVRNFVPAKNSSGTLGMYDLVEDKFYTNVGTGTFVAGSEVMSGSGVSLAYDSTNKTNNKINASVLPVGYQSINYVSADQGSSATRTASINMGVAWKDVGMLECAVEFTTTPSSPTMIFSSYPNAPYIAANTTAIQFNTVTGSVLSTNYTKSQLTNNGIKELKIKIDANTSTNTICFGSWQDNVWSANWNASMLKAYDTKGVLIRDFVPCVNSAGTVGMYDLVEGKFYTNAGTGTFTAGAEVDNAQNTLKLLLKNEDNGKLFGVKYKVEFYAATATGKVKLSSNISGMTAPTSSAAGFVYNSADGYYYYQNSAGTNVIFEAKEAYLMTGFGINYDSAMSNLLGGNAIYMEISVESVAV